MLLVMFIRRRQDHDHVRYLCVFSSACSLYQLTCNCRSWSCSFSFETCRFKIMIYATLFFMSFSAFSRMLEANEQDHDLFPEEMIETSRAVTKIFSVSLAEREKTHISERAENTRALTQFLVLFIFVRTERRSLKPHAN